MELEKTWFNSDENDDVMNIIRFIEVLPDRLELFINPNTSNLNLITEKLNDKNLSYTSFRNAFIESKEYLINNLQLSLRALKLDKIYNNPNKSKTNKNFLKGIESAGLTKQQLKTKFSMLNKLWLNVYNFLDKIGTRIIDFSNNDLVKVIRKFLTFLNSFISSIISAVGMIIPGVDSMKEIKDLIEGYFDLGEGMVLN